ncbi:MAG: hypothetical protein V3T18_06435, partial [Pseudomonadales bacterium]
MISAPALRAVLLCCLTLICSVGTAPAFAAKGPQWLLGLWVLNTELTAELGRSEKKSGWLDG